MKRSIVKIFFGALIFFGFLTVSLLYLNKVNRAVEENTKLILLPEKIPVRQTGENFYVYILLNSQVNKITAVDTVIRFDKEILEVIDVVPLGLFPTYPDASRVIDNKNGLVFMSAVNYDRMTQTFSAPFENIGLFGRITFRVKQSLPTNIDFVYGPAAQDETNIIEDQTGQDILFDKGQLIGVAIN